MTLRVTVEIVPFGDESRKRVIETINISNIESLAFGHCKYVIEHNKYKSGDVALPMVVHNRQDGALELVKKSLEILLKE